MREGVDHQQSGMFSYISAERRVPKDHPLRAIRVMVDVALKESSWRFDAVYATSGRPSIAPEKLLRALLSQALYTVRSERLLMEQLDYNFLFRWFVGLNIDDPVWDVTVFTKNRERLLVGEVAQGLFNAVLDQAGAQGLLSNEHFTVDGTLIEAGAGHKSFQAQRRWTSKLRPMIQATRAWTFIVSGAPTPLTDRLPTPKHGWLAKVRAKRPSSVTPGRCRWTIATAWWLTPG
jgi:transposase